MRISRQYARRCAFGVLVGSCTLWMTSYVFRALAILGAGTAVGLAAVCIKELSRLEIGRFLLVGGTGTLLYFVIFLWLTEKRKVWYELSAVAAFVPSFTFSFTMYKVWAFQNTSLKETHIQLLLFSAKKAVFLGINLFMLYLLVEYARLKPRWAQVIAFVALSILSFFVTRWIFKT